MEMTIKSEAKTVLIADDDPPTRILLKAAISQWGYNIIEACDGEKAWELLQEPNAPRLLIVDWLMPKLDGTELCKRIRKELTFHPYVILLTQVSGTTNIIKGLEAGADEFLSKPFNMAELHSRLSVGERIVKYEETLDKQNKQLQKNISHMETLANLVLEITKKVNTLLKVGKTSEEIQELHTTLEIITDTIKHYQHDSKTKE